MFRFLLTGFSFARFIYELNLRLNIVPLLIYLSVIVSKKKIVKIPKHLAKFLVNADSTAEVTESMQLNHSILSMNLPLHVRARYSLIIFKN